MTCMYPPPRMTYMYPPPHMLPMCCSGVKSRGFKLGEPVDARAFAEAAIGAPGWKDDDIF